MSILGTINDMHFNKYIKYSELLRRLYENRGLELKKISIDQLRKSKKSDTVFILCSGPSILSLNSKHWKHICKHDSFGLNFSFFLPHTPTYHIFSWERYTVVRNGMVKKFQERKERYKDTVIMVHSKFVFRFAHPRIVPEFFPDNPTCCFYKIPKSIQLECPRPFKDEDFDKSLFYRNTCSHVLEIAIRNLGYTNVVLLGVDLHTYKHFFHDMASMAFWVERQRITGGDRHGKIASMIPKGNKYHTFDKYLYSLKEYLERKQNVSLFVQSKDSMLYPKIPAYFD